MPKSKKGNIAVVTIHDACPAFSTKIFKLIEELKTLRIKYNIALVPFFHEKQDLPRFPEFVKDIIAYKRCEIALHGLYHEDRNGRFDDFHTITKATAEEEIRAGLEIFQEFGIKPRAFIPPGWKLNDGSIDVLRKLGFRLAETQEKIVLLSHKEIKKIKVPKVLNWDSSGYPEKNIVNVTKDKKSFNRLIKPKPSIIRIALHPRDPYSALEEQKQMICQLKDLGYMMSIYTELVHKLQATSF